MVSGGNLRRISVGQPNQKASQNRKRKAGKFSTADCLTAWPDFFFIQLRRARCLVNSRNEEWTNMLVIMRLLYACVMACLAVGHLARAAGQPSAKTTTNDRYKQESLTKNICRYFMNNEYSPIFCMQRSRKSFVYQIISETHVFLIIGQRIVLRRQWILNFGSESLWPPLSPLSCIYTYVAFTPAP